MPTSNPTWSDGSWVSPEQRLQRLLDRLRAANPKPHRFDHLDADLLDRLMTPPPTLDAGNDIETPKRRPKRRSLPTIIKQAAKAGAYVRIVGDVIEVIPGKPDASDENEWDAVLRKEPLQ